MVYFILGKFFNKGDDPSGFNVSLSRTLDVMFFGFLIIITYSIYDSYEQNPERSIFEDTFSNFTDFVSSHSSAFAVGIAIVLFYLVTYLFRIPMDKESKPYFISIIESLAWVLLVIILFVDFFKYVLNVSLYDIFPWLAPEEKEKDTETTTIPLPKLDKCETEEQDDPEHEVFNISNNKYTYEDAQAICKSYDATLATYAQIESAYNNGADYFGFSHDVRPTAVRRV